MVVSVVCSLFVSDFDKMMERKKAEEGRRRRRKNVDIINDSDDLIVELVQRMKFAADVSQNWILSSSKFILKGDIATVLCELSFVKFF